MTTHANPQSKDTATPRFMPGRGLLLQRKCACGSPSSSLTGVCTECKSNKLLQTKLTIGASNDPLEQEADRVVERVVGMPGRKVNAYDSQSVAAALVQRRLGGANTGIGEAPPLVDETISSAGQPLDTVTRAFFEPRFGHDFGQVRIHADDRAARSAKAVNALAYTIGRDIVFGSGQYAPGSRAGRQLLAHELAHVVQQREIPAAMPGVAEEKRNSAAATAEARIGQATTVRPANVGFIQRQPESEPPTFPDFPGFLEALELNVGKNLRDYGHHLYRASILHPDEPHLLEGALTRYLLGLNVLKTSYRFAGLGQGAADKLAVGTGILFKGLNFVREGEFVLDFQIDIGKGLKLEANLDLGVNPDKLTEVRKTRLGLGLIGEF